MIKYIGADMEKKHLHTIEAEPEVTIVDTSPREGSLFSSRMGTSEKIALANNLMLNGLRKIECAAFTHPRLTPEYADAEEVVLGLDNVAGAKIIGLAPNETACRRALNSNINEIGVLIAASETLNQAILGSSIKETLYKTIPSIVQLCDDESKTIRVYLLAAFGCHYEGNIPIQDIVGMVIKLAHLGVDEVSLVDTPGVSNPRQVKETLEAVSELRLDMKIAVHFHNTRGLGLVNCLAAYESGVRIFDSAIGGLSGSPFGGPKMRVGSWNVPTEDLVCLFNECGINTGIDQDEITDVAEFARSLIGHDLAGHAAMARRTFLEADFSNVNKMR